MNIRQAAEQIVRAVESYRVKDDNGRPMIPVESRRPIYMEGAPGLGKTAIVEQIGRRLGLPVLSYTMTHHTRQTALGLPELKHITLNGAEVTVTEYTVPEIVADVLRTGSEEGILFLDEINCVSESLTPAMLELLQHKRFGTHRLPENWVILCAGNPERYNRAARAFDAVTLDRVRVLRIEPDVEAWHAYAAETGVRPEIRGYLRLRPQDLYIANGTEVVTPRSWTDLSLAMDAAERIGFTADAILYGQYLQCADTLERFTMYCAVCEDVSAEHAEQATEEQKLCVAELLADRMGTAAGAYLDAKHLADSVRYFCEPLFRGKRAEFLSVGLRNLENRVRAMEAQRGSSFLTPRKVREEEMFRVRARELLASAASNADPFDSMHRACDMLADTAEEKRIEAEKMFGDAFALAERVFTEPYLRAVFAAALRNREEVGTVARSLCADAWNRLCRTEDPEMRLRALRERLQRETEQQEN